MTTPPLLPKAIPAPGATKGGGLSLLATRLCGVLLLAASLGAPTLTQAADDGAPTGSAEATKGSKGGKAGKAGKGGKGSKFSKNGKGVKAGKAGKKGKGSKMGKARRHPSTQDPRAPLAAKAIDARRWYMAMKPLNEALAKNPDDLESRSMLAVLRARMGWFSEAVNEFGLSWGSDYYEREGLGAHADTLRAIGQYEEAAALRLDRLWVIQDEGEEVVSLLGASEDLRLGGDSWGAIDLAERAMALRPRSPVVYAVLAQAYLELGDLDEAAYYLWTSERVGGSAVRGPIAASELAIRQGDPQAAEQAIEEHRRQRISSWQFAVQISEARRLQGNPAEALWMLDLPQWEQQDHRPELIIAELTLHVDLGNKAEAMELCRTLRTEYPGNHQSVGAIVYTEQKLHLTCEPLWPSAAPRRDQGPASAKGL